MKNICLDKTFRRNNNWFHNFKILYGHSFLRIIWNFLFLYEYIFRQKKNILIIFILTQRFHTFEKYISFFFRDVIKIQIGTVIRYAKIKYFSSKFHNLFQDWHKHTNGNNIPSGRIQCLQKYIPYIFEELWNDNIKLAFCVVRLFICPHNISSSIIFWIIRIQFREIK